VGNNLDRVALFASLQVHFLPEPGVLLGLAASGVGLALLGRRRFRSDD